MNNKCKICGSKESVNIGEPVIYKNFPRASEKNYRIYQCNNCKYYFIYPEIDLSQAEWSDLYENEYFANANVTNWQKKLHQKERKYRLEKIITKLKTTKGKLLDLGCGEGYVLKEASNYGFEPYGVDIAYNLSPDNSNYDFFKGNIFEANFPDNFFSAIYMDSVLEHMLHPMETLFEIYRILKPGGVFLAIVPNEDSLYNAFIRMISIITFNTRRYSKIRPFIHPYHVHGFNLNSLKTALQSNKFIEIDIKTFGGNYTLWRAYKFGTRPYFQWLLFYPLGLLSTLLNKQVQLISISVKE